MACFSLASRALGLRSWFGWIKTGTLEFVENIAPQQCVIIDLFCRRRGGHGLVNLVGRSPATRSSARRKRAEITIQNPLKTKR